MERLQKILAHAGIASRRTCEELIKKGRVQVNGKTAQLGQSADPAKDQISLDHTPLKKEEHTYIILHKPQGYVSTVTEEHGMKTVMQLIHTKQRVYPAGRLDKHSEGLMLFTNDGELANTITHPRYGIKKTYTVLLDRPFSESDEQALRKGIPVEGRKVVIDALEKKKPNEVTITLHEGRKHIVRKLFKTLNHYVKRLIRIQQGPLKLGNLAVGKTRTLTKQELQALKNLK